MSERGRLLVVPTIWGLIEDCEQGKAYGSFGEIVQGSEEQTLWNLVRGKCQMSGAFGG